MFAIAASAPFRFTKFVLLLKSFLTDVKQKYREQ